MRRVNHFSICFNPGRAIKKPNDQIAAKEALPSTAKLLLTRIHPLPNLIALTSIPRKRSGVLGECLVFFMSSMDGRKGTQNIYRRKSDSLIKTDSEDLRCCSDLKA